MGLAAAQRTPASCGPVVWTREASMREDERPLWALSTAEEVEVAERGPRGTFSRPGEPVTSEQRIEGRLVEEDGKLVLFYGPI
jgi:hypothetical protein